MASKDPNPTGEEIRRVRESMGLTLMEFGKHVGLPWQTLQAYEAGRAEPPAGRLFRILHATRRAPEPFRVMYVARAIAA